MASSRVACYPPPDTKRDTGQAPDGEVTEPDDTDAEEDKDKYTSFGFVEVGELPLEGGGYPLNRSSSLTHLSTEALVGQQRRLERELEELKVEFQRLKERVSLNEAENEGSWTKRYSQRMAVMANMSLGVWIFWSRFVNYVRSRRALLLQGVVLSGVLTTKKSMKNKEALNVMLTQAWLFAIKHSWVLFIAAFLLTRREAWKRYIGLIISTLNSLYIAFFTDLMPWTSFFVIFANLLYATASIQSIREDRVLGNLPALFDRSPPYPAKKKQKRKPSGFPSNESNNNNRPSVNQPIVNPTSATLLPAATTFPSTQPKRQADNHTHAASE